MHLSIGYICDAHMLNGSDAYIKTKLTKMLQPLCANLTIRDSSFDEWFHGVI